MILTKILINNILMLWRWSQVHNQNISKTCVFLFHHSIQHDEASGYTFHNLLVSFDWSNNTGAIDVKMDGSVLQEISLFKMLELTFSCNLDWSSYIISIAKTASKKIGALPWFVAPEVALYLYKSAIWSCVEHCHVCEVAPSCYLQLSDKLHKQICRIVGPALAASLELWAFHGNIASLSLFYRYYFGRCSSELAQQVSLPYTWGRSTCEFDRLHDFSVSIPRCCKNVYVNSFFPCKARLSNSDYRMLCFDLWSIWL